MIREIIDMFRKSEDEPIEFNKRYIETTKKNIEKRKNNYANSHLFEKYLAENKQVIEQLKKGQNRAASMSYFDDIFTTDRIIKELRVHKENGTKIIGTMCNLVPEELIYAAGGIPIRLCSGCDHAVSPAEEAFPRDSCPLIKSTLGFAVTDQPFFNLCDAVIIPASCDGKKKLGEVLNDYIPVWMMDLPQSKDKTGSKKFWFAETRILKKRLEELTGKKINRARLKDAIVLLHKRYNVVRKFLEIRKRALPVISGRDALIVMQAAFFDDINRWTEKTQLLCEELEQNLQEKRVIKPEHSVRILLTGAPTILPNFKIPNIIERFDAIIAIDETCAGTQLVYDPVVVDEWNMLDMMSAVSERYLMPSVCPCFVKSEDRIDKLMDMIKDYKIDGIIYHTLRLCLLFDIESQRIKDVMSEKGVPFLQLNTDYSKEDLGQLQTRIEAFVEIIGNKKE